MCYTEMLKTVNSLTKNIAGLRLGCVELFQNHIFSVDGRILRHTHHEYTYFWQISPGTNQKQLSEKIDVESLKLNLQEHKIQSN